MTETDRTPLGDRMKDYERFYRANLPRHTYVILRLDGRAFHTYLRDARKPFDDGFIQDMAWLTERLCKEISGSTYAYTQSDEISILLQDVKEQSEPWFAGQIQKVVSVSAGLASALLTVKRLPHDSVPFEIRPVVFDARVFALPTMAEVNNYFMWRQRDCIRNAISMAAQARFSHKELQGVSSPEMIAMLLRADIDFLEYPQQARMGTLVAKEYGTKTVTYVDKRTQQEKSLEVERSWWQARPAPEFSEHWGSFVLSNTPIALSESEPSE